MSKKEVMPDPKIAYFKKHQRDNIYHYYEVHGGKGRTSKGFQVVVNFLNTHPIIFVAHNYVDDPSGLTGTWCIYEVGEPITKEEYQHAYNKALSDPLCQIR